MASASRGARSAHGCETPFGDLHAIATHLGLSIRERRSQARALLDMIGDASPCVALGDFNDWFWPGSVRSVLRQPFPAGREAAPFRHGARFFAWTASIAGRARLWRAPGPTAKHVTFRIIYR